MYLCFIAICLSSFSLFIVLNKILTSTAAFGKDKLNMLLLLLVVVVLWLLNIVMNFSDKYSIGDLSDTHMLWTIVCHWLCTFANINMFSVHDFSEFSDHCPISFSLNCNVQLNENNSSSYVKYRWSDSWNTVLERVWLQNYRVFTICQIVLIFLIENL